MYHERVPVKAARPTKRPSLHHWSRSDFLRRANEWAERRGCSPISEAQLLDWKKDGLVPKVGSRSKGKGRGSEGLWGATAYRQVLRVVQLRQCGIHRRRQLRLHLWIEGFPVPWQRVRADLQAYLGPGIRKLNEELGSERWPTDSDHGPAQRVADALDRHLTGKEALSAGLMDFGLPRFAAEPLAAALQRPELKEAMNQWAYHLFSPNSVLVQAAAAKVATLLPPGLREGVIPDEHSLDLFAGVLMPPRTGANRAWRNARFADEQLLNNMRDFANNAQGLWTSCFRLTASLISLGAAPVPRWSTPALAGLLETLSNFRPLRDVENQIVLAALMLNRRQNLEDHGEPLGLLGRAVPPLFNWLADNPHVIEVAMRDPHKAERLLRAAALPPAVKDVLNLTERSTPAGAPAL